VAHPPSGYGSAEMLGFAHLKRILKLDRYGYEAHMGRVMSSFSQSPPRTFARWQS